MADPVEQWLLWEAQANLVGFRTSTEPVPIEVAEAPRDALDVFPAEHAPTRILRRFLRGKRVRIPRHPLNRDASVAFADWPVREVWTGRYTSSRTLVVPEVAGDDLFSVKLATDHPHPDFLQPEKTKLRAEVADAIAWVALLDRVRKLLGLDPFARIVREVLGVLVPGTETGFLVRDLRGFRSGWLHLPALSIPWVGRQIARLHQQPFSRFWGEHYAAAVGRAKARVLIRSGLQFDTPNPQNVLVQLDPELRPNGVVVIRDLGDANCASDARDCRATPWTRLLSPIRPETRNSFWAFGEAGDHAVDAATLEEWYALHDAAYARVLSGWLPELAPEEPGDLAASLAHWDAVLGDTRNAATIQVAHERMARRNRRFRRPRPVPPT